MKNYFIHHQKNIFSNGSTFQRYWIPLEFLNAIAILRKDGIFAKLVSTQEAEALAEKEKARFFISTTPLDLWQCPPLRISKHFFRLCQKIASANELYVLGYHGTLVPELMLKLTGAQTVVKGEPEGVISQISKNIPLDEIQGLTFKKDGRIVSQPNQLPCDLTEFPVPAYDQVDFNYYEYELMGWRSFALFETSRGCKYNCEFCCKNIMYGKGFRQKTIAQVKQELENAIIGYGVKTGYFFDLDFLNDKQMVIQICDYLIKKSFDFQWCCQTRIDEVDECILKIMAEAGCRLIHYGVESYQHLEGGLKYKKQSIDTLKRTIQLTKSLGIETLCFYIIGFKNRFSQQDRNTLQLMHNVNSSYVSLHQYYNFYDQDFVKARIMGQRGRLKDRIGRIIPFHYLLYYLHPLHIRNFIFFEKESAIFRRLWFFLKTIISVGFEI